jgi:integrase
MANERSTAEPLSCPRGISVREFVHKRCIQVAFSFRGEQCHELLPPRPVTQVALDRAAVKRRKIIAKIADGTFQYADYFPNSERACRFAAPASRALITVKLEAQRELYRRQVKNRRISPSTLHGYEKAINSEKYKYWTDKVLTDATPAELREWIGGFGVTAKFARNLLIPLRSLMEDALNDGLIEFDPFDRIALNKLLKQTAADSDYTVDPYNAQERAALVEAARHDERPLVAFWFESGLRPGELFALRHDRIDREAMTVRIDTNFVQGTEKAPKTAAGVREVTLNAAALAALDEQLKITPATIEHVFINPATGRPWETDTQLRKSLWTPLNKRAKVRYRRPYQVRHTFASSRLTDGHNPWFVAQQLGHASDDGLPGLREVHRQRLPGAEACGCAQRHSLKSRYGANTVLQPPPCSSVIHRTDSTSRSISSGVTVSRLASFRWRIRIASTRCCKHSIM